MQYGDKAIATRKSMLESVGWPVGENVLRSWAECIGTIQRSADELNYEEVGEIFGVGRATIENDFRNLRIEKRPGIHGGVRRTDKMETIDGVTDTVVGHCRRKNVNHSTVVARCKRGMTLKEALIAPLRRELIPVEKMTKKQRRKWLESRAKKFGIWREVEQQAC